MCSLRDRAEVSFESFRGTPTPNACGLSGRFRPTGSIVREPDCYPAPRWEDRQSAGGAPGGLGTGAGILIGVRDPRRNVSPLPARCPDYRESTGSRTVPSLKETSDIGIREPPDRVVVTHLHKSLGIHDIFGFHQMRAIQRIGREPPVPLLVLTQKSRRRDSLCNVGIH